MKDRSGGCAQSGAAEGKKRRKDVSPLESDAVPVTQEHGVHKGSDVLRGEAGVLQGLGVVVQHLTRHGVLYGIRVSFNLFDNRARQITWPRFDRWHYFGRP